VAAFLLVIVAALAWWLTAEPEGALWRTYGPWAVVHNLAWSGIALLALYVAFGKGGLRDRVFRVVLLAGVLGLIGAAIEFPSAVLKFNYGKWLGPPPQTVLDQLRLNVNRPDPELIHVHWPHSEFRGKVYGNLVSLGIPDPEPYEVDLRYDHNGFRNDVDLEQVDVAAIGDSFVEAALLPSEEAVVKLLEQRLGGTAINLGQAAYGLKQELVVLERYALPLRPRLVLWFFFGGNDLRDVRNYERVREALASKKRKRPPFQARAFTINALTMLAHFTTPPRSRASDAALENSGLFTRADGTRERLYFGQTSAPWKDYEWNTATETLLEADRLSREAGARLVVVYIPRKFRVYRDYLETTPGTRIAEWDVNDLPSVLGDWCREKGIDYVDTVPRLQESIAAGEQPYFYDDVHWNSRGHAIAADAVTLYLREIGWFDGAHEAPSGGPDPG
jgi:lysophospholipase L1-like esterase